MTLKKQIKRIVPSLLWGWLHRMRCKWEAKKFQRRYKQTIRRLQAKSEPLNVVFLAIGESDWKYDSLYVAMQNDATFNPIVVVCPQINYGQEFMLENLHQCADFFKRKGYKYVLAYDEAYQTYVDANSLKPDVVCFSNPYEVLTDERYHINKFPDALTCYINYGYNNHTHEWGFNLPFHQQLWRYFVECEINKQLVSSYSPIKGDNCVVTGYPMYDAFIQGTSIGKDWKQKNRKLKRIIWAPHHTIGGQNQLIHYSTFDLYYDVMWKLALKYHNEIQIVFKPHPLLKEALYRHEGWGKERTDAYYDMWSNGENTSVVNGEYIDLFNSSDAMINDSGSFTIEYLYTRKPCLLLNNYNRQADANQVSLQAIDCWYQATTAELIDTFIKDVVLEGNDPMRLKRESFYNEVLLPPNGCSVAENIMNEIKKQLKR